MSTSYPQTIDISVLPVEPVEARLIDLRTAINQTIGADAFLLIGSLLIGTICSGVANGTAGGELPSSAVSPLSWFVFGACNAPSLLFLAVDTLGASRHPMKLPFAYPSYRVKAIYAKRIRLALLGIYFSAIFSACCWSVPALPLVSKLFVAAMLTIALYAVGQNISSVRKSFMVTGAIASTIFLAILAVAQLLVWVR